MGNECVVPLTCGSGTRQDGLECVPDDRAADPLIGSWATSTGRTCDFFPTRAWNQHCLPLDGWAKTWARVGENQYVFESTYRNCWAQTTFSNSNNSVQIRASCGGWERTTFNSDLTRNAF
jgi:hypothetical protein